MKILNNIPILDSILNSHGLTARAISILFADSFVGGRKPEKQDEGKEEEENMDHFTGLKLMKIVAVIVKPILAISLLSSAEVPLEAGPAA